MNNILVNHKNIKIMKKNIGKIDKAIRIILALVIAILVITQVISGTLAVILLILSGVLVLTSIISFCPLYLPCHINTGKKGS